MIIRDYKMMNRGLLAYANHHTVFVVLCERLHGVTLEGVADAVCGDAVLLGQDVEHRLGAALGDLPVVGS